MIRALKIALIVFAVIEILMGLLLVFFPDKLASSGGISDLTGYLKYIMALLGICLIVPGSFLIIAARDPLRHINWVKFAIVWFILATAAGLYSIVKGDVNFSHAGILIILHAAFAVVLLALYPWRAASSLYRKKK
jgi:hypothetical protein